MRSWFRIGLRVGLLAGVAFAVVVTLRSRRTDGGGNASVGVHGDWPDVRRSPDGADHHPHGRVTVPLEAAPMGAPPAVETTQPGRDEPEVPEPTEHLDEELTGRTPAPASAPPAVAPRVPEATPAKAENRVKKAAKKAAKTAAAPAKKTMAAAKKTAAPVKKAPAKAKSTTKKAQAGTDSSGAAMQDVAPTPPPAWIAPEGSACPASHPVKAKLASRLFHLPGMFAYNRTVPDRCYLDAAAAEADGLTRARR